MFCQHASFIKKIKHAIDTSIFANKLFDGSLRFLHTYYNTEDAPDDFKEKLEKLWFGSFAEQIDSWRGLITETKNFTLKLRNEIRAWLPFIHDFFWATMDYKSEKCKYFLVATSLLNGMHNIDWSAGPISKESYGWYLLGRAAKNVSNAKLVQGECFQYINQIRKTKVDVRLKAFRTLLRVASVRDPVTGLSLLKKSNLLSAPENANNLDPYTLLATWIPEFFEMWDSARTLELPLDEAFIAAFEVAGALKVKDVVQLPSDIPVDLC